MAELLDKDYVLVALDTGKQVNAREVIARVRPDGGRGGIPWMAVLDGDGKSLITSDGPKGNIGCPWQPHEIEYFRVMLERTRQKLTDGDLDAIIKALEAYKAKIEQERKK